MELSVTKLLPSEHRHRFLETYCVTSYGSGWKKATVKQSWELEFGAVLVFFPRVSDRRPSERASRYGLYALHLTALALYKKLLCIMIN